MLTKIFDGIHEGKRYLENLGVYEWIILKRRSNRPLQCGLESAGSGQGAVAG
jgi:hypothetical protein